MTFIHDLSFSLVAVITIVGTALGFALIRVGIAKSGTQSKGPLALSGMGRVWFTLGSIAIVGSLAFILLWALSGG